MGPDMMHFKYVLKTLCHFIMGGNIGVRRQVVAKMTIDNTTFNRNTNIWTLIPDFSEKRARGPIKFYLSFRNPRLEASARNLHFPSLITPYFSFYVDEIRPFLVGFNETIRALWVNLQGNFDDANTMASHLLTVEKHLADGLNMKSQVP